MAGRAKKEEKYIERLRALTAGTPWITLGEWLELWHEEYVRVTAAKSTADAYRRIIRNHIPDTLRIIPLRAMQKKDVDDFVELRIREGAAKNSVRFWLSVLRAACGVACECSLLRENPCRAEKRELEEKSVCLMTDKSIRRMERASNPTTADIGALIILYTGLKMSELLGLRWEDVSLDKGLLTVRHILQRGYVEGEDTRTSIFLLDASSPRSIVLEGSLMNWMTAAFQAMAGLPGMSEKKRRDAIYVVHPERNFTTYFDPRAYQKYLQSQGERLNIEDLNCNMLRDTAAARMIRSRNLEEIAQILGVSMGTVLKKYESYSRENQDCADVGIKLSGK